jgi:hypothetical protein
MTFVINKNTALIPGYAYYQNKQTGTIAYTGATGGITAESDVPYADVAHIASLAATHAVSDTVTVTADALRSWSRGDWRNAGVLPGSAGIPELTNLHVVVSELGAEARVRFSKTVGTELRYRYRTIDDKVDDAEDGTFQFLFAGLTVVW